MKQIVLANNHLVFPTQVKDYKDNELTKDLPAAGDYDTFYQAVGLPRLTKGGAWIVAKGHPQAPRQWVVWYPNGRMWSSFGGSMKAALDGAIDDCWFYI